MKFINGKMYTFMAKLGKSLCWINIVYTVYTVYHINNLYFHIRGSQCTIYLLTPIHAQHGKYRFSRTNLVYLGT